MAMINCVECGNSMSDHAQNCPNCGAANKIMFCPECEKQLSVKAERCPNCGYVFKNNVPSTNDNQASGLSIAAFVCSLIPVSSFVGLILGIVTLVQNKGKSNTSKKFGLAAVIISAVYTVLCILYIMIWFLFIILAFSAEY